MNWRKVFASIDSDAEELADLKDADEIHIEIHSAKGEVSWVEGSTPVDTIAHYRTSEGGKWVSLVDADSGEQDGLATIIPEKIGKVLAAYGLGTQKPKPLKGND